MADLATCLTRLAISREDQIEIGADPKAYQERLLGELGTLRGKIAEAMEQKGLVPELDIPRLAPVRSAEVDVLDQVPVEQVIDADGKEVARTMSRADLAAELDADDEFGDLLEICAK